MRRLRRFSAISAMRLAASAVTASTVWSGRSLSGSKKTARRISSFSGWPRSSSVRVYFIPRVPVKSVWTSMRSMSETTRRGGFSSDCR